jgi:hypothetical protein
LFEVGEVLGIVETGEGVVTRRFAPLMQALG